MGNAHVSMSVHVCDEWKCTGVCVWVSECRWEVYMQLHNCSWVCVCMCVSIPVCV